ncbi:hypothetical protein FB595_109163 [Sphingobium sp. AEW010]|nr:hypothetical protein [Sphingobium sp. JAI105]TWD05803.1 hypothetical protein FB595_109163 [Sphingobium sp. AEW010]TWD23356.1 hypothetical protein FB596_109163 [Sphingobium sp. AEW013]TWD25216.1 hypothetical protein FB594_109163 [Sphingobium sp. AEW001]
MGKCGTPPVVSVTALLDEAQTARPNRRIDIRVNIKV